MFLSVFSSSSEFRYLEGGVGQVGTFILLKYTIEDLPYLQPNHLHRNVLTPWQFRPYLFGFGLTDTFCATFILDHRFTLIPVIVIWGPNNRTGQYDLSEWRSIFATGNLLRFPPPFPALQMSEWVVRSNTGQYQDQSQV